MLAQYKRPSTYLAVDPSSNNYQDIQRLRDFQPERTGVLVLNDGLGAFAVRIALIDRASQSIDAQYYMLKGDLTGDIFLARLLKASKRGVRVRLLIDDINTASMDDKLTALAMQPNIELRVFNPFYQRGFRGGNMLGDFGRLNKRMHNKSLTIDGLATVVGGRNIGDEYFAATEEVNFNDFDALAIGPVVEKVSQAFDLYWNSEQSYPIEALNSKDVDSHAEFLKLEQQLYQNDVKSFIRAHQSYAQLLADKRMADFLYWCDGDVLVDHPVKGTDYPQDVSHNLAKLLSHAEQSILLSSPYFIPGEAGSDALVALADKGIDISVLTNSLAATDVAAVHAGYKKYRKRLVEGNVFIYELKPDAKQKQRLAFFGKSASRASLHSKVFVIDEETLFVGSFNWDPRSISLNTEMGLVLTCPDLGKEIAHRVKNNLPYRSYQLSLDSKDDLVWTEAFRDKAARVYDSEPQASIWRKFQSWIIGLLPVESQL
ncbi:phospholipase D family protein [Agarivorans gilvus]|uniref:Phospholipase D family protein n=2 Tax=Agarivorans gilvus TaxID=680279 RepID=A0ABQ1HZF4_9ALTE|nr:phospholipase D family protein [Agarivorans gilvus]